jgi:exodeoxyribonuclease-3
LKIQNCELKIMKIISWNVNGIRAVVKKGFVDFLKAERPDILCLQEIKISDDARNKEIFDFAGYQEFWHSAIRPGYSGTMTLVKDELVVASEGKQAGNSRQPQILTTPSFGYTQDRQPLLDRRGDLFVGEVKFPDDPEGRVQILEFAKFYLVNVYFPNANAELSRLDFKLRFNDRLLKFLNNLEMNPTPPSAPIPGRGIKLKKKKKPIIICGDFNVAHEPIDLFHPKANEGSAGYTIQERNWMTKFLQAGFVDTFRAQNPAKVQYSWWSYRMSARERNVGWRIDYFCVSSYIIKDIERSFINDKISGSDHCPVGIILKNS